MTVTECDDEFLMLVAHVLGSETAASRAMAERDRRKAAGEDAVIYWNRDNGSLTVGPRYPHNQPSAFGKRRRLAKSRA